MFYVAISWINHNLFQLTLLAKPSELRENCLCKLALLLLIIHLRLNFSFQLAFKINDKWVMELDMEATVSLVSADTLNNIGQSNSCKSQTLDKRLIQESI